jgi:hypothetical protein
MTSCCSEQGATMLTRDGSGRADLAALLCDLSDPPMTVGLTELAELWTYESFRFLCPRPPDMEDYPELSERLRGAFGAALHRQPQPATATGRARAHPCDVLFGDLPGARSGEPLAKPIVIRAAIEGQRLIVELRVFGCAIGWRDEAAVAMLDALGSGIALRSAPRAQRVPVRPTAVEHGRVSCLDIPSGVTGGTLRFRSPFTLRRRGVVHATPSAVLPAMLGRIERMARWQGCRLTVSQEGMRNAFERLAVEALRWDRVVWCRYTRNQGSTPVPMIGHLGELSIEGPLGEVATLLAIAETCNAGSHTALGMGWFDWIPA